jgi:hypothetical protein
MALLPEYPFQRTRLQPQPVIPQAGASGLAAATQSLDRGAAMLGAEASQRTNQAEAENKAQARSAIARKEANAEAEGIANARQEGENASVRDTAGNLVVVRRDNSTSANRAFNVGADAAYFSSLQVDWRGKLAQLATGAADDPEKFRVGALRAIEEAAPQIDASVRGEATRRLRVLADEHYAGLLHSRAGADRQMAQATWQRQLTALSDDVNRLAEGGQIGSARYADATRQLEGHLTAGVGARFIDEGTRDFWRTQITNEGTARALGAEAVRDATRPRSVPTTYAETVRALESPDGRPNAMGSGATGPYQIMPSLRAQFPPGTPDTEILEKFTDQNRRIITDRLGRAPTEAELFLAHRLGAGGALALLRADPATPIADVLRPVFTGQLGVPSLEKVLEQNPYLGRGGTAGGVIAQNAEGWARAAGRPPPAATVVRDLETRLLEVPGGDRVRNQVMAQVRSDLALAEGQRRQDLAELQASAEDTVALLRSGRDVPPDAMASLATRARELGDPQLAQRYALLGEVQGTVAASRAQPVPDILAAAQQAESRASDFALPEQDRRRAAALADELTKLARAKATALNADALTYGARVHGRAVGPLEPIDWANPDAAQATLRTRVRQAGLVQQTEGVPTMPLTAPEMATLKARASDGTAEQRAAVAATLLGGLGPEPFRRVLTELALGNDRERGFAVAAAIAARGDNRLATEILQGADVLRENPTVGWQRPDFNRQVDAALGGAITQEAGSYGAILVAARDLYAARAFAKGELTGNTVPSSSDVEKIVKDITGGVLTFNGGRVIAPTPGMTQENFTATLRQLPPTALDGAMAANGVPFTREALLRDGRLKSVGDGRYFIDTRSGHQVTGRDGQRFMLDLRR